MQRIETAPLSFPGDVATSARLVEGPVAEEIRIQLLERFARPEKPNTGTSDRRAVLARLPVRTAQLYRIGERGNDATL